MIYVFHTDIIHQTWLYSTNDFDTSSWSIVLLQRVGIIFIFSIILFIMFCFSLIIHLIYLHNKESK